MSRLRLALGCWNYDRARAAGWTRAAGWNRPRLARHVGRGGALSYAVPPRIRRRRNVPLLIHGVALSRSAAVHRDPGAPVALVPPFKHLRQRGEPGDYDFRPYGFGRNRDTRATFLRYHHEQGPSKRRLEPKALFAPETLEGYRI